MATIPCHTKEACENIAGSVTSIGPGGIMMAGARAASKAPGLLLRAWRSAAAWAAGKAAQAPFKTGDLVYRTFKFGDETIEFLGEATIKGQYLKLSDIAVYPMGTNAAKIGPKGVRQLFRSLATQAKSYGFDWLHITGTRVTGAKIGKNIDFVVDLRKL